MFKNADMELNVNIESLEPVCTDYFSRKIATTTHHLEDKFGIGLYHKEQWLEEWTVGTSLRYIPGPVSLSVAGYWNCYCLISACYWKYITTGFLCSVVEELS